MCVELLSELRGLPDLATTRQIKQQTKLPLFAEILLEIKE